MNTFKTLTRISFAGIAAAVAASLALPAQAETNLAGETDEWTIPFSEKGGPPGLIRTARKLADGNLYIPASIWENQG